MQPLHITLKVGLAAGKAQELNRGGHVLPLSPMEPVLPPNWRSAKDADGKEYYFNELTGETSWKVPEADSVSETKPSTPSGVVAADASAMMRRALAQGGRQGTAGKSAHCRQRKHFYLVEVMRPSFDIRP